MKVIFRTLWGLKVVTIPYEPPDSSGCYWFLIDRYPDCVMITVEAP